MGLVGFNEKEVDVEDRVGFAVVVVDEEEEEEVVVEVVVVEVVAPRARAAAPEGDAVFCFFFAGEFMLQWIFLDRNKELNLNEGSVKIATTWCVSSQPTHGIGIG